MTTRRNFADRVTTRRAEAQARALARASRSVQVHLALLATRPGESKRERTRLA